MKMSGMKLGMMACCAVIAVPLIGYFAIGGSVASGGGALGAALPLLACVALHGAMFLFMEKSCHSDNKVADEIDPADVIYPNVLRQQQFPRLSRPLRKNVLPPNSCFRPGNFRSGTHIEWYPRFGPDKNNSDLFGYLSLGRKRIRGDVGCVYNAGRQRKIDHG